MTQEKMVEKKVDFASIGEPINHDLAGKMVKTYNDAHPDERATCFNIGRTIIESILAQPNCTGIKFFNAIDEIGQNTLVYAGIDQDGKTIMEITSINEIGKLGKVPAIVADRTSATYFWFES